MRKSSYAMCVNFGPPLMSPNAKTPAALVSNRLLTRMNPRSSVAMPAAETFNESVLGTRPVATSRCDPSTARASSPMRTVS